MFYDCQSLPRGYPLEAIGNVCCSQYFYFSLLTSID